LKPDIGILGMTKTLFAALIFTLFSSISFGGSLDGKGLICGNNSGYWFESNTVNIYQISGHIITVDNRKYVEVGTDVVKWTEHKAGEKNSGIVYEYKLDRRNLTIGKRRCIVATREEITDKLNIIIEAAKRKNKI
jgi:hypothetical protein